MGIKVRLNNVRLAFAQQLFVPSAVEEGKDPKYGCDSLLVAGSTVVKLVPDGTTPEGGIKYKVVPTTMEAVLLEVATEQLKDAAKAKVWLTGLENSKKCHRNGDLRVTKGGDPYEGYEGIWYVAAKSKARPTLIDGQKRALTVADGKPYSGCYANVSIDVYGITDPKRKGVHAAMKAVQFVRDGDAFGGGSPGSPDDFESIEDGADAATDLV